MRIISTALILIVCVRGLSQEKSNTYFKIQSQIYSTQAVSFGGGAFFSSGAYRKNVLFGLGVGFIHFGGPSPYVPVFAEVGVLPRNKKLSPLIVAQIGYGFSSGAGDLDKTGRQLRKGLFFNPQVGAAFRVGAGKIAAHIGATILQSNTKSGSYVILYSYELFTGGISYIAAINTKK